MSGKVVGKFVTFSAITCLSYNLLSICIVNKLLDQPFIILCFIYHFLSSIFFTLSIKIILCPHGICATTCCTNSMSGYSSAIFFIYFRFLTEKPVTSGNSNFKSMDKLSINLFPHLLLSTIIFPICQYININSLFTTCIALYCDFKISFFTLSKICLYSLISILFPIFYLLSNCSIDSCTINNLFLL